MFILLRFKQTAFKENRLRIKRVTASFLADIDIYTSGHTDIHDYISLMLNILKYQMLHRSFYGSNLASCVFSRVF